MLFRRVCRPCYRHFEDVLVWLAEAHPIYALGGCTNYDNTDLKSCWVLAIVADLLLGGFMGKLDHLLNGEKHQWHKHWRKILFEAFVLGLIQHYHDDWTILVSHLHRVRWYCLIQASASLKVFASLQEKLLELWFDSGCGQETKIHISLDSWIDSYQFETFAKDARASVLRFSESEPWRRHGIAFFLAKATPFLEIGNLRNLLSGKMKSTLKRLKSIDRQVGMSLAQAFLMFFSWGLPCFDTRRLGQHGCPDDEIWFKSILWNSRIAGEVKLEEVVSKSK